MVTSLTLAACGTTPTERGLSGAGIGAGAGAVLGAVTGLTVLEGALIGAATGGLTGALTDNSQVNLGDPVWKQRYGSRVSLRQAPAAYSRSSNSLVVRNIQLGLARLGYDPGPADGVAGTKTQSAIRRYQQHYGLLVDGRPTPQLAAHIQAQLAEY